MKKQGNKEKQKTKLVLIHVTSNFKISKNNVGYLSLDTHTGVFLNKVGQSSNKIFYKI